MFNYDLKEKVGEGIYGVVYRAKERHSKRTVAMKRILLGREGVPATTLREVSLLKELNHPNVVKLEDVVLKDSAIFLVFEYLDMDLKNFLNLKTGDVPIKVIKSYMFQILRGLAYCHSQCVMHRDLKPQNLLLDLKGNIKLADFGLSRAFAIHAREYTPNLVTYWYRPPEILLGVRDYTSFVDIWSAGCIFGEMLLKKPIFRGKSEIHQLAAIFCVLGTPDEESWPGLSKYNKYKLEFDSWPPQDMELMFPMLDREGHDLLMKLITYCPESRVSAKSAVMHPFFKNVLLPENFPEL